MKNFLFLIGLVFVSAPVWAMSNINVSDYEDFDNTWANQKVITNQEFETTMDALEEKKNQADEKQRKKRLKKFKGSSLHTELDATKSDLPDQTLQEEEAEELVVLFPVDVLIDNKVLEKGYYRTVAEKKDGKTVINLYQSHEFKARLNAYATHDDFGEKEITFVKLLPFKDGVMKLIYGSIEVNAFAYVRYVEPSLDFSPQ